MLFKCAPFLFDVFFIMRDCCVFVWYVFSSHLDFIFVDWILASASLYCADIHVNSYQVDLCLSLRFWTIMQGDSPGIARINQPRRSSRRSLCSQRRSSSSSRGNTLAGLLKRKTEVNWNTKTLHLQRKRQSCVWWITVDLWSGWSSGSWIHFTSQQWNKETLRRNVSTVSVE